MSVKELNEISVTLVHTCDADGCTNTLKVTLIETAYVELHSMPSEVDKADWKHYCADCVADIKELAEETIRVSEYELYGLDMSPEFKAELISTYDNYKADDYVPLSSIKYACDILLTDVEGLFEYDNVYNVLVGYDTDGIKCFVGVLVESTQENDFYLFTPVCLYYNYIASIDLGILFHEADVFYTCKITDDLREVELNKINNINQEWLPDKGFILAYVYKENN